MGVLLGNVCLHQLPHLPPRGAYAVLLLVVPLLWRFAAVRWLAWGVVAFSGTGTVVQAQLDRRVPADAGQREVVLTGWIDDFPGVSPDRTVFTLRVVGVGLPARVRLSWYDAPAGLAPGVGLELVARLRAPRGLANPGGFDYARWAFVEEIGATGYVRSGSLVATLEPTLAQRWLRVRAELARRIEAAAPSRSGGALLVALTLGERHGFEDSEWADLRRTGTSHLVAISGLHVGLIAALVYALCRAVCLRAPCLARRAFELAALASASAAGGYAALAGFAVPTQRALIMVLVALAIMASRRRVGLFNGLAAAAVIVIVFDPIATLTASFWLSFGAVGLLLLLAGRGELHAPMPALALARRKLRMLAQLQWSITLGLAPLTATYFGELSIVSPVVNLIAIPFFSFVMVPLSLLAALTAAIGTADVGLVRLAAQLADVVWRFLHAAASFDGAAVRAGPVAAWVSVLAAGAAAAAMPAHPLPGRRLLWLALVPLVVPRSAQLPTGVADILILDVGHGLAALIETRDHTLLFDAGPVYRSGFDTGSEIVVPALAARSRVGLDMLVISHADSDHAGGAAAVLAAFPDVHVLKGPDVELAQGEVCAAGRRWTWNAVSFEILHPAPEFAARGNESSCVLKVTARGRAMLLTGDIEARAERALAERVDLAADVVVVPHHGSATSSSSAFVAAVRPTWAIVSAGHDNRWGFPRADVRDRWERTGARLLVTGDIGAIRFRLGEMPLQIAAERRGRQRYWRTESAVVPGESDGAAL